MIQDKKNTELSVARDRREQMRRLNAAAFAPAALRRASPKLGENHAERRGSSQSTPRNLGQFLFANGG